jgi:hypothetical protein
MGKNAALDPVHTDFLCFVGITERPYSQTKTDEELGGAPGYGEGHSVAELPKNTDISSPQCKVPSNKRELYRSVKFLLKTGVTGREASSTDSRF